MELVDDLDETLLRSVLNNVHHVLHHILPARTSTSHAYSLRSRRHDRALTSNLMLEISLLDNYYFFKY